MCTWPFRWNSVFEIYEMTAIPILPLVVLLSYSEQFRELHISFSILYLTMHFHGAHNHYACSTSSLHTLICTQIWFCGAHSQGMILQQWFSITGRGPHSNQQFCYCKIIAFYMTFPMLPLQQILLGFSRRSWSETAKMSYSSTRFHPVPCRFASPSIS